MCLPYDHAPLASCSAGENICSIDERSRDIITRRWLAEDQEETLRVLADKYGVSAERIRQIEVKAMKQMRKVIENLRSRTRKGQALRGLFYSFPWQRMHAT